MYCSNCGNKLDYNNKYCNKCGNKVDNTDIIKPLVTNVGVDRSLPKNMNFLITILLVFAVSYLFIGVINKYREENKFVETVSYNEYTFKVPLGYKSFQEDGRDSLLMKNSNITFELMVENEEYNNYIANDFEQVKSLFNSKDYKYTSITEMEKDNHKMIFSVLDSTGNNDDNANYAFYMSRINGSDDIVWGYIYKHGIIDSNDAYNVLDIVNNIE